MSRTILLVLWSLIPVTVLAQQATMESARHPAHIDVQQESLPEPLQRALKHLARARGFSCRFEQKIFYQDGGRQQYEGHLAVAKPDKFRWQYTQPYEQLYVSNGDGVWFYEPDLMQVQRLQSLDSVDPIMMRFLSGRLKYSDIHLLADDGLPGIYHVRLSDGPMLWISVNAQGNPAWLESEDALGNRNRITLMDMHFTEPEAGLFDFVPPKGVDVVDFSDKNEAGE
jgi:outer membrane lipoprotein carrier protein